MPAPSQSAACNGALALLGESNRVTDINSDGTPLAKVFLQTWDQTVDEVLADHPWNVAVKRQACAVSAFVPDGSEYSQAFDKPADCLRWLPWKEDHPDYFAGVEEGSYILSNAAAPIIVRYIARVTQLALWSPGMRAALEAKLAEKNAKAITGQTSMIREMRDLYENRLLPDAKRQDGLASGDRRRTLVGRSDWLNARSRPFNGRVR